MREPTSGFAERRLRLQEVLLGYMRAAGLPHWPGTDGLMLAEVLNCYPHAVAAGLVPGREELLLRHADLADALADVFAIWELPDGGCGGRTSAVDS